MKIGIDPNPCHKYPWGKMWACPDVYSGSHACDRPRDHEGLCHCACGAEAEEKNDTVDRLRSRLRVVAQILIPEVGADGPMDAEDAALTAVERMGLLRELADGKARDAGLYARRMEEAQESRRKLARAMRQINELLEWNGCDCDCEHDAESHDASCDRCLACRIEEVSSCVR